MRSFFFLNGLVCLVEHGFEFCSGEFVEHQGEGVGVFDVADVGDADVVFEHDVSEGEEASFDDV